MFLKVTSVGSSVFPRPTCDLALDAHRVLKTQGSLLLR